jgi:hypothetical protein
MPDVADVHRVLLIIDIYEVRLISAAGVGRIAEMRGNRPQCIAPPDGHMVPRASSSMVACPVNDVLFGLWMKVFEALWPRCLLGRLYGWTRNCLHIRMSV